MTKQQYISTIARLRAERFRIIKDTEQAEQAYIAANSPCNVGDVVTVRKHTGEEVKGIVGCLIVDCDNNIVPRLFRIGKNGNQTNKPIIVSPYCKVIYPATIETKS